MRAVLVIAALLLSACASPTAPPPLPQPPCQIPSGPVVLRVLVMGHRTNQPLVGLPAHVIAGSCISRTLTNSDGVAEWHLPAGVYTVGLRHTDYWADRSLAVSTQWLLSLPE